MKTIPNFSNYLLDEENFRIYSILRHKYIGRVEDNHFHSTIVDDNGVKHRIYDHRLIYELYYGNIPKGYVVHHKDENKLNNNPNNLALLTLKEHTSIHQKGHHRTPWNKGKKGFKSPKKGCKCPNPKLRKKVIQMTKDGEIVKFFESTSSTKIDGFTPSAVSNCCLGKRKQHKGYVFKYAS